MVAVYGVALGAAMKSVKALNDPRGLSTDSVDPQAREREST